MESKHLECNEVGLLNFITFPAVKMLIGQRVSSLIVFVKCENN